MLGSYIQIAWRNMVRNKPYSFINIVGLAIGLSCFLIITLYIIDELSYDKYHSNAKRIARVNTDIKFGGGDLHIALSSDVMGELLKKDYPEVEQYTRIYTFDAAKLIKKGKEFISESQAAYVDPGFFDVFSVTILNGIIKNALAEPNTVVITKAIAEKYFGTINAAGKNLELKDGETISPYKVVAVIDDMPARSHFRFEILYSMKNLDYKWGGVAATNFYTYILFKEGTDVKAFEKNFSVYINRYVVPFLSQVMPLKDIEDLNKNGNQYKYSLMPLTEIHLNSDRAYELSPGGNMEYLYIFGAVAFFILIIASINFINLTTARSFKRTKEIGIRKILGTGRKELVFQFLIESGLMVLASLGLALLINYFAIDLFNSIAAKQLKWADLFSINFLPLLIATLIFTILSAGGYPAFFLSRFNPIQSLKGRMSSDGKAISFRSSLVVFQFATSIILIISTVVLFQQLRYIQTTNLGYNKDEVLIVNNAGILGNNAVAFKNEVLAVTGVTNASFSMFLPVTDAAHSDNVYFKDATLTTDNGFKMENWRIDGDYISTLGMQITKGRNFQKEGNQDSASIIINESAAKILGYTDPIGKYLYSPGDDPNNVSRYTVVGVVKNFNYESLRKKIEPMCFLYAKNSGSALFKLRTSDASNVVVKVKDIWSSMGSGEPMSYRFLDESFNEMYKTEQRSSTVAIVFSVLAISIACFGLFGLVAFIAEQRTKEIGIRKVLGASISQLTQMLSKEFLKLVLIASLIAFPIAWWGMNKWLQNYAYRIDISWWIFVVAGIAALIIAFLTVSFQAIKTALANPVKSLRTE